MQPPTYHLPQMSKLPLQETVHRFADEFGLGRLRLEAIAAVHDALGRDLLQARCNREDFKKTCWAATLLCLRIIGRR